MKDNVFSRPGITGPFIFDDKVAACFDDMIARSVPFYAEVHRLIIDVLEKRTPKSLKLYDLGCSTGTTIALIKKHFCLNKEIMAIGVDSSSAMGEKCREKWAKQNITQVEMVVADLCDIPIENADVVIMNYTLQFIPPSNRSALLHKIYQGLRPGGIFFMAEKIEAANPLMHDLMNELYYDFKRRQGYSELEIAQKREALENVLVPMTPEKNLAALKLAGFSNSEMLFKWYNFASFVGIRD